MMTTPVNPTVSNSATYTWSINSASVGGEIPPETSRATPPVMAGDQSYYWTETWQRDQAESLAEIGAGLVKRFDSSTDAIRWLLSEDDE